MDNGSRFGAGLARGKDSARVAREACAAAARGLEGRPASLVALFASPGLCASADALLAEVHRELAPFHLIGAMGEAIVGDGHEVEDDDALAVWAAHLPGARIVPFRLEARPVEDGIAVSGWPAVQDAGCVALMLADPFTFPADGLLQWLDAAERRVEVVGGLASGGARPGDHRLFASDAAYDAGAVGVLLSEVALRPVVSQGCTPVGPEMVVTDADGATIVELAGVPAAQRLEQVLSGLDDEDRRLAVEGLLLGIVIDENRPDYVRGDFLVRGIVGLDRETGALVVGERVRVGQTVRLHVRDALSADRDLRAALRDAQAQLGSSPAAALLFSCNGRGTHMFAAPDHDARALHDELGRIPAAGMFCNGEIGPVGGRNYLHAFTATMAVFGREGDD